MVCQCSWVSLLMSAVAHSAVAQPSEQCVLPSVPMSSDSALSAAVQEVAWRGMRPRPLPLPAALWCRARHLPGKLHLQSSFLCRQNGRRFIFAGSDSSAPSSWFGSSWGLAAVRLSSLQASFARYEARLATYQRRARVSIEEE